MKLVCTVVVAILMSSCTHDYWKMKQQTEDLRLKTDHIERMLDKCVDVCGMGNVKTCAPRMGQVECHSAK